MWKYAAAAFGLAMIALDVTTGAFRGLATAKGRIASDLPVSELLDTAAATLNGRRGEEKGGAVFRGAHVHGTKLIYEFEVPHAPKKIDAAAASRRLQKRMVAEVCKSKLAPALQRGAAVVMRYESSTGRELFEARVDAVACNL